MNVEKKVAYPAIVGALAAFLGILTAFNVAVTEAQVVAILGFATALTPILTTMVGWLAPHTERPDLFDYEDPENVAN